MRNKILFTLVVAGLVGALLSAVLYARPRRRVPPLFSPAPNPYAAGIYANGIVESDQSNGENINIYPEVSGTVIDVLVAEGQPVRRGTALFLVDDSIQRAVVEQQKAAAGAAHALYEELRAQPRPETLAVARAQMGLARASLKNQRDSFAKQERSFAIDPRSVSRDVLDTALNATNVAQANLDVATRQFELTRAGAWSYDIRNQRRQYEALSKAWAASSALLSKYTVLAPTDGVVLSVHTTVGSYVSPAGAYDTYTQGFGPPVVMGTGEPHLAVRCYIDEILIPRLPPRERMQAKMFIRGTNVSVPLEFVRVQPYVSPKIQLSNQRTERVDVRVLPVIFRFSPPKNVGVYPGQLVDVYVGAR